MFRIVENHGKGGLACVEEGWSAISPHWGYPWHVFSGDNDQAFATESDARSYVEDMLDTWDWCGDVSWRTQYVRHENGGLVVEFKGFDDDDKPLFETETLGGDYRRARDFDTIPLEYADIPDGYELVQPGKIR